MNESMFKGNLEEGNTPISSVKAWGVNQRFYFKRLKGEVPTLSDPVSLHSLFKIWVPLILYKRNLFQDEETVIT